MRLRHMPMTEPCCFVFVETQMNAKLCFLEPFEMELKICWGVVNRIATNNDKQFDFARIEIRNQILQRLPLIYRVDFKWVTVENGLAYIAQRVVHRVCNGVNHRRLLGTGDDNACAFVLLKIFGDCLNPKRLVTKFNWVLTKRAFVSEQRLGGPRFVRLNSE